MNFLLDTHTFLWWSLAPENLPQRVLAELKIVSNRVVFSAVSAWEAQIKIGLGKLDLKVPLKHLLEREIEENQWEILPVHLHHTWRLSQLKPLHKDPFDRLLVAQALSEDLILVSRDPLVSQYPGVQVFW